MDRLIVPFDKDLYAYFDPFRQKYGSPPWPVFFKGLLDEFSASFSVEALVKGFLGLGLCSGLPDSFDSDRFVEIEVDTPVYEYYKLVMVSLEELKYNLRGEISVAVWLSLNYILSLDFKTIEEWCVAAQFDESVAHDDVDDIVNIRNRNDWSRYLFFNDVTVPEKKPAVEKKAVEPVSTVQVGSSKLLKLGVVVLFVLCGLSLLLNMVLFSKVSKQQAFLSGVLVQIGTDMSGMSSKVDDFSTRLDETENTILGLMDIVEEDRKKRPW